MYLSRRPARSAALVAVLLVGFAALTGCEGPDETAADGDGSTPPPDTPAPSGAYKGSVALTMTSEPSVKYNAADGTTTVVVQFSAKGDNDQPLQASDYTTTLLVNDRPLDNESLLDESSQELAVNLNFTMVLDASYSMTQHTPPAFEPMKAAAAASYQDVLDAWSTRQGEVEFRVIWFDNYLNESIYNEATAREWRPDDLLALPTPQPGDFTKLFASVNKMTQLMAADYNQGIAAGPRDQHVMLVFSDGVDNYSWWDNTRAPSPLITSTGASYLNYGVAPVTLDSTTSAIEAHPSLTTHVIGLGSAINEAELKQIADAGDGVFLKNPSSENLDELFDRIVQEVTTIQTVGAMIPLQPGDYTFTVRITNGAGSKSDAETFRFHAGDTNAGVLP